MPFKSYSTILQEKPALKPVLDQIAADNQVRADLLVAEVDDKGLFTGRFEQADTPMRSAVREAAVTVPSSVAAIPAAGAVGVLGAKAGAVTSPVTGPVGPAVGGLAGGLAGGVGGYMLTDSIIRNVLGNDAPGGVVPTQERTAINRAANPWAVGGTEAATALIGAAPRALVKGAVSAIPGVRQAAGRMLATGAALGGGLETYRQSQGQEGLSPGLIALHALAGATGMRNNSLGERLFQAGERFAGKATPAGKIAQTDDIVTQLRERYKAATTPEEKAKISAEIHPGMDNVEDLIVAGDYLFLNRYADDTGTKLPLDPVSTFSALQQFRDNPKAAPTEIAPLVAEFAKAGSVIKSADDVKALLEMGKPSLKDAIAAMRKERLGEVVEDAALAAKAETERKAAEQAVPNQGLPPAEVTFAERQRRAEDLQKQLTSLQDAREKALDNASAAPEHMRPAYAKQMEELDKEISRSQREFRELWGVTDDAEIPPAAAKLIEAPKPPAPKPTQTVPTTASPAVTEAKLPTPPPAPVATALPPVLPAAGDLPGVTRQSAAAVPPTTSVSAATPDVTPAAPREQSATTAAANRPKRSMAVKLDNGDVISGLRIHAMAEVPPGRRVVSRGFVEDDVYVKTDDEAAVQGKLEEAKAAGRKERETLPGIVRKEEQAALQEELAEVNPASAVETLPGVKRVTKKPLSADKWFAAKSSTLTKGAAEAIQADPEKAAGFAAALRKKADVTDDAKISLRYEQQAEEIQKVLRGETPSPKADSPLPPEGQGADAVSITFKDPDDAKEAKYKLGVFADTDDLLLDNAITVEEIRALIKSIPQQGKWQIPAKYVKLVADELDDHALVLHDQAREALSERNFAAAKKTTQQAKRFEKLADEIKISSDKQGQGAAPKIVPLKGADETTARHTGIPAPVVKKFFAAAYDKVLKPVSERLREIGGDDLAVVPQELARLRQQVFNALVRGIERVSSPQAWAEAQRWLTEMDDLRRVPQWKLSDEAQTIVDQIHKPYKETSRLYAKDAGIKVKDAEGYRDIIADPFWSVNRATISQDVMDVMLRNPKSAEAAKLTADFVTRYKRYYKDAKTAEAFDALDALKDRYSGVRRHTNERASQGPDFAALRRAEGMGLPPSWRMPLKDALYRHAFRSAADIAWAKTVQNNPNRARQFGIKENASGDAYDFQELGNHADPAVQALLKEQDLFLHGQTDKIEQYNALVNSMRLGPVSAVRDVWSGITATLDVLPVSETLTAVKEAAGNWFAKGNEGARQAGALSRYRPADLINFTSHKSFVQKTAEAFRTLQGRNLLESSAKGFVYEMGQAVFRRLQHTDPDAITRVTGSTKWKGQPVEKAAENFAASLVDYTQSTYGPQDLPAWALRGSDAKVLRSLFGLQRYSIGRFNRWKRQVADPIFNSTDPKRFKPLLRGLFGAAVGAAALDVTVEAIFDRKPRHLTLKEWLGIKEEGKYNDTLYALASMMESIGYAGLLSHFAHTAAALSSPTPSVPASYSIPAVGFAGDVAIDLANFISAVQRPDIGLLDALKDYALKVLPTYTQGTRLLVEDKADLAEKRNERIATRIATGRGELERPTTGVMTFGQQPRPFPYDPLREFREAGSVEEAYRTLPGVVPQSARLQRRGTDRREILLPLMEKMNPNQRQEDAENDALVEEKKAMLKQRQAAQR